MSLLNQKFTGRIRDGKYDGAIVGYAGGKTEDGKEFVTLDIQFVGGATQKFMLFEQPFSWAMRDIANQYYSNVELTAEEMINDMLGAIVPVVIYTNEYAGRKFQRISFNPNFGQAQSEPADDGQPDELEFK